MKAYVYDPNRSYGAYLQQGGAADPTDVELPPRAALLIGAPQPGMEGISATALAALLEPPFHWGRTERMMALEGLGTPLVQLKHGSRTSAEMWAYEQFDIARDAFRRELWPEALRHLEHAIRGDGSQPGYELDFRFHFLLGLIRLGNFRHHDPALLDFKKAADAFFAAGRLAKSDHPAIAVQAFFAAGWAYYVQGQIGEALAHTNLALALNANIPEIQFQAAKILLNQGQPDAARPCLTRAVALHPSYAAQALQDADFAPHAELIFEILEAERLEVGRKASQILQNVAERAEQFGLFTLDEAQIEQRGFRPVLVAIDQARAYSREYSLHGYLRAAAAATQASETLIAAMARIEKARRLAEDAIHAAEEKISRAAALEIGSYRLNRISSLELGQATAWIAQAKKSHEKNTFQGSEEAEECVRRAMAALEHTLSHYRSIALQQAMRENAELEIKLATIKNQRGREGSAVKLCAVIGALIALFPGGYFSFFSSSPAADGRLPEVVLRGIITTVVFALFGALIGTLFAPMMAPDPAAPSQGLEKRLAALKQTIDALRKVSLTPPAALDPADPKNLPT